MGIGISIVAVLIANSASGASAAERTASTAYAVRFEARTSATATVGGRIIGNAARIGAKLAPPAANMVARSTTISAADGSLVPALVYDFE